MIPSFGTDGIRGHAGTEPLTPQTLIHIGKAIALSAGENPLIIIGMDTRESGHWICDALCKGIMSVGGNILFGGVMPTAAVSCATIGEKAQRGIMITASHNPFHDNGIKIFANSGRKLNTDQQERLLHSFSITPKETEVGSFVKADHLYTHWKRKLPKPNLSNMRILVDCAHGAAAPHAPQILEELGAELVLRGCAPTGTNINKNVGALHPPTDTEGCDLVICFDGDADRLALLDRDGNILDGDDILWLLRDHYSGPLVGTVLSNGGLEEALKGRLLRSAVGDSNVEALMHEQAAHLGAEPSGHVLFSDGLATGDGMYTALRLLECLKQAPVKPTWTRWPVCTENIKINTRIDLNALQSIKIAREMGQRVIVRYSGTEPLLRIMVEGIDAQNHLKYIREEFLERCS
jgi:phosphoglucosamine mutase